MLIVTLKRSLMLSAVLLVAALAGTAGTSSAAIKTGVYDLFTFSNATQRADSLEKTRAAGSNLAKSLIYWRNVAPGSEPANPRNPDVGYNWAVPDAFVNGAISNHLQPVLTIFQAPNWASGKRVKGNGYDGVNKISTAKFHDFAIALAKRYKGEVHYYEVWNEPNLPWFFTPQLKNGKFVSPAKYRALVNAFASGIHSVDRRATVIGGNTAPFGHPPPRGHSIGPKPFLKRVVSAKVRFDAWSTHPYTYGGPTHHAANDSDVSLGDMGELRKILNKARRSGKILGSHKPQLWASEFSWDSKGPDSRGVRMKLLSRWISETVYRLNKAGVNTLLWFGQRDRPFSRDSDAVGLLVLRQGRSYGRKQLRRFHVRHESEGRQEGDLQRVPLSVCRLCRKRQGQGVGQAPRRSERPDRDLAQEAQGQLEQGDDDRSRPNFAQDVQVVVDDGLLPGPHPELRDRIGALLVDEGRGQVGPPVRLSVEADLQTRTGALALTAREGEEPRAEARVVERPLRVAEGRRQRLRRQSRAA